MRFLPVIKAGQKLYFVDVRLRQFRSVVPHPEIIEFIEFGDEPWERVEWMCYHDNFSPGVGCPDCHFTEVIAHETAEAAPMCSVHEHCDGSCGDLGHD
jgi:hypothetical protein